MSLEQIQTAMGALVSAMLGKGVITPRAEFIIKGNEQFAVHLQSSYDSKCLNGSWLETKSGDAPEALISWANEFVSSLKSAEEKVLRTYLGKLADAVDYGHENGIAAEYVDPVRITQKAMSENLLSPPTTINPKSQECDHPFCGDDCGAAVDAAEPAEGV